MYLKKMIATGFKSFADKTTIDFTKGVTGIVGPNGSGKSNVVDGVRWVLGEQSVKSLRGDGNMTEVIFSGSKSRNAMHVASVTLIFDNQDHYLPLDTEEIAIRRRVYQDGTNEYSMNNERCRLKDITDVLLDSGMAKESFNIISQGKIEEIISSKPEARRTIFEEAANVLKYKKRKIEALHKLERTHDNMTRIDDILGELKEQVEPLKQQHDQALIYQEKSKELEQIEIALMAKDIMTMNVTYQNDKTRIDTLNEELLCITTENTSQEAKIESYKNEIHKLDSKISHHQEQVLQKSTQVEKINSEKNILLERKKYQVEDTKLHNNLVSLKDQQLKLESDIHTLELEIAKLADEQNELEKQNETHQQIYHNSKQNRFNLESKLTSQLREKNTYEYQIRTIQENIDSGNVLPYAVRSILNGVKLRGICDAIGNLIEVEEKYATAITTSLGYASSYIVVENEASAKEAIAYLKQNNLGRVTFFPRNIIAPKKIDQQTLHNLSKQTGYVGIASTLLKFNQKYQNIIENQLGNVIVAANLDCANKIAANIQYRYKIVTVDGELLHVGGSLTGGSNKQTKNIITEKYELEHMTQSLKELIHQIESYENDINEMDTSIGAIEDKLYLEKKEIVSLSEIIIQKNQFLQERKNQLIQIKNEMKGTDHLLNNSLSIEEEEILSSYYQAVEGLKQEEIYLEVARKKRETFALELEDFETSLKRENSELYKKSRELKELEIEVNRLDVKLDNLLSKLNENYHMTYEKASTYDLTIPEEEARNRVSTLRKIIHDLGNVNLGAIEEYDRVSTRYEFLNEQKEDLTHAKLMLLDIISEMDVIMEKEFKETFDIIEKNFSETFKELFKGGQASLKLTDPSNLLETGIEIVASPPGKKLSSISLLSGGEKTFTAISLLFAILKSKPVPFCILDEVEAALDEVNVDSFGEYVMGLKEKTQFILITHKKRTMEYVDVLYGITMQESGVSKLVSVKLEEINNV